MPTNLAKRERVMRTMRFEETDRVPCYGILENAAAIEHYAGEALTPENGQRVKGFAIGRVLVDSWHCRDTLCLFHSDGNLWTILDNLVDVSQLLPFGEPELVRAVCRQTIADAKGRWYFLGSTTALHWDVKLENAIAVFGIAQGGVFQSTVSLPLCAV